MGVRFPHVRLLGADKALDESYLPLARAEAFRTKELANRMGKEIFARIFYLSEHSFIYTSVNAGVETISIHTVPEELVPSVDVFVPSTREETIWCAPSFSFYKRDYTSLSRNSEDTSSFWADNIDFKEEEDPDLRDPLGKLLHYRRESRAWSSAKIVPEPYTGKDTWGGGLEKVVETYNGGWFGLAETKEKLNNTYKKCDVITWAGCQNNISDIPTMVRINDWTWSDNNKGTGSKPDGYGNEPQSLLRPWFTFQGEKIFVIPEDVSTWNPRVIGACILADKGTDYFYVLLMFSRYASGPKLSTINPVADPMLRKVTPDYPSMQTRDYIYRAPVNKIIRGSDGKSRDPNDTKDIWEFVARTSYLDHGSQQAFQMFPDDRDGHDFPASTSYIDNEGFAYVFRDYFSDEVALGDPDEDVYLDVNLLVAKLIKINLKTGESEEVLSNIDHDHQTVTATTSGTGAQVQDEPLDILSAVGNGPIAHGEISGLDTVYLSPPGSDCIPAGATAVFTQTDSPLPLREADGGWNISWSGSLSRASKNTSPLAGVFLGPDNYYTYRLEFTKLTNSGTSVTSSRSTTAQEISRSFKSAASVDLVCYAGDKKEIARLTVHEMDCIGTIVWAENRLDYSNLLAEGSWVIKDREVTFHNPKIPDNWHYVERTEDINPETKDIEVTQVSFEGPNGSGKQSTETNTIHGGSVWLPNSRIWAHNPNHTWYEYVVHGGMFKSPLAFTGKSSYTNEINAFYYTECSFQQRVDFTYEYDGEEYTSGEGFYSAETKLMVAPIQDFEVEDSTRPGKANRRVNTDLFTIARDTGTSAGDAYFARSWPWLNTQSFHRNTQFTNTTGGSAFYAPSYCAVHRPVDGKKYSDWSYVYYLPNNPPPVASYPNSTLPPVFTAFERDPITNKLLDNYAYAKDKGYTVNFFSNVLTLKQIKKLTDMDEDFLDGIGII